jgi:hypothetical protein
MHYRFQIDVAPVGNKFSVGERPREIKTHYIFAKNMFCAFRPSAEKVIDVRVWC